MIPLPTLLTAYRYGFFPMADASGGVEWYSPDPRGILPIEQFHASRRLLRTLRQGTFEVTVNRAFSETIAACASRGDEGAWINERIIESYTALHRAGYAHSVEAWQVGVLAGGLYGVSLRGAFFGESMFHCVTDASKVVLWSLVQRLRERGYQLLDVQWVTPHLARSGAIEISRPEYLRRLEESLEIDCTFV